MNILNLFGVIDIVIVLFVILSVCLGYKKGLLLKIVSIASSLFGLIMAFVLVSPMAYYIGPKYLNEPISLKVNEVLIDENNILFSEILTEENKEIKVREAFQEMELPSFI